MGSKTGLKILKVGILNEVHNLDPRSASDVDSMFVLRQVVEAPFDPVPGAASLDPVLFEGPLEPVAGGAIGRLRGRLRTGVRFSDGSTLSAEHLAKCFRRSAIAREQADVTVDGNDLIFDLRRANARFDTTLSHLECSAYVQVGESILGTGPFQIAAGSTPQHLRLIRNPHYRKDVALDEIHFRVYPVDAGGAPTALIKALERDQIQYCNVLPRDDISRLSGVRKSFLPGVSTAILYLNCERGALRAVGLRRAIGHAINRLKVAESCYSNALAFTATSILPRGLVVADDDLVYDLSKANACLAEVGVAMPSKLSGLLTWGPRPYLPNPRGAARVLAEQLAKLGTTVEWTTPANSSEFFARTIGGEHDLVLAGWAADTVDPCDFLDANLASDRVPTQENLAVSANHGRYRSADMDALLAHYRSDGDVGTLSEVMALISAEAPLVPLIYGSSATIMSFRVLGFRPSALPATSLAGLDLRL